MHDNSGIFRTVALLALVAVVILPASGSDEKTTLSLVSPRVVPGNQAYVTVMLANTPGTDVLEIQQWIEFPKSKLTFVAARTGIAADMVNAELKVEVKEKSDLDGEQPGGKATDDNTGTVHITVVGKRNIPDGPVAEIIFQVPPTLDEQIVTLPHRAEAMAPGGAKIPGLVFEAGEVKVSKGKPGRPSDGGHMHEM